jgi:hypothetical protein
MDPRERRTRQKPVILIGGRLEYNAQPHDDVNDSPSTDVHSGAGDGNLYQHYVHDHVDEALDDEAED